MWKKLNKCVSRLARRKSHHTALVDAAVASSECPPTVAAGFDICFQERTTINRILFHRDSALVIRTQFHRGIHARSNAAAPVTPREPIFTKRGEDLSG